ncbi:MAG: CPBP family intramembrane metalloprotease [Clostridia bacterium]|nr:CPBP family intramembrane metalloprotease [Clostridia bacterium]
MQNDAYRRCSLRLGAVLICNLLLIGVVTPLLLTLITYFPSFGVRGDNLLAQLALIVLYVASFVLPAGLYFLFSRGEKADWGEMWGRMPRRSVWLIFASLGVIIPATYLNQLFIDLFELIGLPGGLPDMTAYFVFPEDAVLFHLSIVLVPAFCEELLFRGVILDRLLPYGKTAAILISAVAFGLMHGNFEQLFYATVAGIMLGLCYAETHSIWPGVIVHMLNNLWAYLSQYWYEWCDYTQEMQYNLLVMLPLLFLGALSALRLLSHAEEPKTTSSSVLLLGQTPLPAAGKRNNLRLADAVRCFCTQPTVIVYLILSVGMLLSTVALNAWLILLLAEGIA